METFHSLENQERTVRTQPTICKVRTVSNNTLQRVEYAKNSLETVKR